VEYDQSKRYLGWEGEGILRGGKWAKSIRSTFQEDTKCDWTVFGLRRSFLLLTENLCMEASFFQRKTKKENAKCQPIRQTSYFYVDIKYLRPSRNFKELKIDRLCRAEVFPRLKTCWCYILKVAVAAILAPWNSIIHKM